MKKIVGIVLTLCLILSLMASIGLQTSTAETYAADKIRGSAILHCFNWSYDSIRENLAGIAAAGYTAVQTSPVQQPKDYNASYTNSGDEWWKLYQPLGLSISESGASWLGGPAELGALCEAADEYGIKVIVDIVANHLANNGTSGGGYANLSPDVEADLKNAEYYHTDLNGVGDGSRYDMTQKHLGMPDLNTGSAYIRERVLDLLKACVDLGVDGFRFDAAKHIELPTDPEGVKSDFWPYVINGIKDYKSDVFCYGEILYNAGTDIANYTQYISVTDSVSSAEARSGGANANAGQLADGRYQMGEQPGDAVLWVESHDTYEDGSSSWIGDAEIVKSWAIVGARADSTALYLARPNATMGEASSDTTWSSKAVAEVNKFKTRFYGTSEYLSYDQNAAIACVERGNNGVVIAKLNGAGSVSLQAHRMNDGIYQDQVGGGTFTVSGGVISGNVGSTGVAVVYDRDEEPCDETYYLFGYINGSDYGCESDWENLGEYKFVGGKVSATFSEDSYVAVKTGDNQNWYMTNGWQGEVSSAELYNTKTLGDNANKLYVPGETKVTFTLEKGENGSLVLSYEETPVDHYLFGYINGANYGENDDWERIGTYKFVDGKLTARFSADSYVGVKDEYNANWYMTDGWQGSETTSVTLFNSADITGEANKMFVPANTKVTFTLEEGENDTFTLSYKEAPVDYYLFGWINGANYGCEENFADLGEYRFVDGKLTAVFAADSYVAVKDEFNENWYMTDGWQGEVSSATLYNTATLGEDANKLFVPGGKTVVFTLSASDGGALVLSYETSSDGLKGDLNGDGTLSIEDVSTLLDLLAAGEELPGADLDGSGVLSIEDVSALLDLLANV